MVFTKMRNQVPILSEVLTELAFNLVIHWNPLSIIQAATPGSGLLRVSTSKLKADHPPYIILIGLLAKIFRTFFRKT